jgi:hypothetical protein
VKFTYLSAEDLMWLMAVAEAKALRETLSATRN